MTVDPLTPLADDELRDASRTLIGLPVPNPQLTARLEFVAEMLAAAGRLPPLPLLLWREASGAVRHHAIGPVLTVGRQAGETGVSFEQDKLLSRSHFSIRPEPDGWWIEDLNSRNGTALNSVHHLIRFHILRDGDSIYSGDQVFVFLDQSRRL
jgi:hypothetical protein